MAQSVGVGLSPIFVLLVILHTGQTAKSASEEKTNGRRHGLAYLVKYGYLNCTPDELKYKSSTVTRCTKTEITEAIRSAQEMLGISSKSGKLDKETISKMNEGRCGDKDTGPKSRNNKMKSHNPPSLLIKITDPQSTAYRYMASDMAHSSNEFSNESSKSIDKSSREIGDSRLEKSNSASDEKEDSQLLDESAESSTRVRRGSLAMMAASSDSSSSSNPAFHMHDAVLRPRELIIEKEAKVLRKEMRTRIEEKIKNEKPKSREKRNIFEDLVNAHKRRVLNKRRSRTRRSSYNTNLGDGESNHIYWTMPEGSKKIPMDIVHRELEMAMSTWSRAIPISFRKKSLTYSLVDSSQLKLMFAEGEHGDGKEFDGPQGDLAHSVQISGNSGSVVYHIHFDDAEEYAANEDIFNTDASNAVDLFLVAMHEVGHALGLPHSTKNLSIMNPVYKDYISMGQSLQSSLRLSDSDRLNVQEIYGVCKGSFDAVIDILELRHDGDPAVTPPVIMYMTFFHRGDHFWIYENQINRTQPDNPKPLSYKWSGLPAGTKIDAIIQIPQIPSRCDGGTGNVVQDIKTYIFAGEDFYLYENDGMADGYGKRISDHFGSADGGVPVPSNLDTVHYDYRMNEVYFFKGDSVWIYNACLFEQNACCTISNAKFSDHFIMDDTSTKTVTGNIDSIYYSYNSFRTFMFQGEDVYEMNIIDYRKWVLTYLGPWYGIWRDICDV